MPNRYSKFLPLKTVITMFINIFSPYGSKHNFVEKKKSSWLYQVVNNQLQVINCKTISSQHHIVH